MGRTWVTLQLSSDEQDSEAAGEIEKMRITAQKICIFYSRWGFAWSGLLQPNLELIRLFVLQREH